MLYEWDETKRETNLAKHGLDFSDARWRLTRVSAIASSVSDRPSAKSGRPTMRGSKVTVKTSEQMRAARRRGNSRTDWERVRREGSREPGAAKINRQIGETIARKRGRPVVGEPKTAISLRIPNSILARWKETGPGWQTRMAKALGKALPRKLPGAQ